MNHTASVTRTLKATPQAVFDAWTDAHQLQQWLCPEPGVVGEALCDPVVGGSYRLVMVFSHGTEEVTGKYLVVEPPYRLVFTWRSGGVADHETRVSVDLQPVGASTEMTITHDRIPTPGARDALAPGWANVASRLDRLLTTQPFA